MITFTDTAKEKVLEFMNQAEGDNIGLRIMAQRMGRRNFQYQMTLVTEEQTFAKDTQLDMGGFTVFVDPASAELLEGTSVDFATEVGGAGFRFDNPQAVVTWDDPLSQKVQEVIDERILPSLRGHGGWIDLIEVKGDTAVIEFGGGCQGCGMSQVTLKDGIEAAITEAVPEITTVVDNTDHGAGTNPYMK
jgi:Fe/S biogenesis protein NfuA